MMITEDFICFLWQYQYFSRHALATTAGDTLQVIRVGSRNQDAGPDFTEATVRIGVFEWMGNVEIHLRASDWRRHRHQDNPAYDTVILHVVWEDDEPVYRSDHMPIPTLVLKDRENASIRDKYLRLAENLNPIPCGSFIGEIPDIVRYSAIEQSVVRRLEKQGRAILRQLERNTGDWEETAYQWIAQYFGFKMNNEAFAALTESLPWHVLKKHSDSLFQVEAMLFGQAMLLRPDFTEAYPKRLYDEYQFLKHKFSLEPKISPQQWKFLRLRPYNFPTLRIAQFAAFVHSVSNLLATLIEAEDKTTVNRLFIKDVSPYWETHFRFEAPASRQRRAMGQASCHILLVNTWAPLLAAYGMYAHNFEYIERAMAILQQLPFEENRVTKKFAKVGWEGQRAFDSQGMIEIYSSSCAHKKCLQCPVGVVLLKPANF